MRLRSSNTISLLIVVLSAAALAVVPGLRLWAKYALARESAQVDYVGEAERRGDDAQVWLAVFSGDARRGVSAEDRARARERLIELLPDSAAPYLLDGVQDVPLSRGEVDAWEGSGQVTKEEPLTDQQRGRANTLLDGFERASQLDPDNAAIDYLRAYLAFADHRDEEAYAWLRDALAKDTWDLYQREAAIGAYEIARAQQPPGLALYAGADSVMHPQLALLLLVRTITGMAILAEQRGDHAQAIFLRESAIHLAQMILRYADGISDALVGVIAWTALAQPSAEDLGPGEEVRREDAPSRHITDSSLSLVAHFREQQRPDLAEEVLSFSRSADEVFARIGEHIASRHRLHGLWPSLLSGMSELAHAALWALGVIVAAGIAALVLKASGRRATPVRCSRLGWVVILAVIFAVVFGAGLLSPTSLAFRSSSSRGDFVRYLGYPLPAWGDLFVSVGLPLILLAVLVVVVLRRQRGRGFTEALAQYAATLIAVVLPLTALFCVALVGLAAVGARDSVRHADSDRAIVEQGELKYYGLGVK